MKRLLCVVFVSVGGHAVAQNVALSSNVATTCIAAAGTQLHTAALPIGAMPASGVLQVNTTPLPSEAIASFHWDSVTSASWCRTALAQYCTLTAGGLAASCSGVDVRLALTAGAPLPVQLLVTKSIQVSAGLPAPMLRVDLGDDGTFELTEAFGVEAYGSVVLGSTPFHVRMLMDAGTAVPGTIANLVTIDVLPASTNVANVVGGCSPVFHGAAPRFDGNIDLSFDSATLPLQPGIVVLGLTPQAVVLNVLPFAACVLIPSPDLLVLAFPGTSFTLNVPPAARPVTIWTQGVGLQWNVLVTSNGLRVDAM